ncbi:MAG: hypothetical protein ACXAAK_04210 [Candidatus Thorarchaeota archaeon]|jgi:hypothetical protein
MSGKKQGTGQTLGALALILSIAALGLGLYQFILPTAVGPQIYIVSNDDLLHIDGISSIEYLSPLNITYSTKVGDSVVLEFSCQIYLYPATLTTITLYFYNNGTYPSSTILVTSDSYFETSAYMRHTFEATTAGENYLVIIATIDDETSTYIRNSLLTVTVN